MPAALAISPGPELTPLLTASGPFLRDDSGSGRRSRNSSARVASCVPGHRLTVTSCGSRSFEHVRALLAARRSRSRRPRGERASDIVPQRCRGARLPTPLSGLPSPARDRPDTRFLGVARSSSHPEHAVPGARLNPGRRVHDVAGTILCPRNGAHRVHGASPVFHGDPQLDPLSSAAFRWLVLLERRARRRLRAPPLPQDRRYARR